MPVAIQGPFEAPNGGAERLEGAIKSDGQEWQREQNNIRAARFAGCPAAVLAQ